ncbi:hypothetical protein HB144_26860 (plasmid) [Escherichia coli]|nr:hypothetical protein HB144_26860 [Escherichia coli]
MPGTGVMFRDTVTVSGCFLLRPLRLPGCLTASGRQAPTPTGSCWRTRQSPAEPRWRGFGLSLRSDA